MLDRTDGVALALELDGSAMRARMDRVMERLVHYVSTLPEQPAGYPAALAAGASAMRRPVPEKGTSLDDLLGLLFDVAIPPSFNAAGPGYMAYVPGGGIFDAAVGRFVGDVVNRYTGVWAAAPHLAELESDVLRWFAEIMCYPPGARGWLTSGGSLATLAAIVTARRERLPENFLGGVVYVSEQTHHCVAKAVLVAGFPARNVVTIASEPRHQIDVAALERAIADDRRRGRTPFLVAGSAGTTNTGAIDDLPVLADLCAREGLWFHVDAAYGGFFRLAPSARDRLAGLERSDSLVLDPHKGLFLPFGTGAVLVRDGAALRRAFTAAADYMPPMQDDAERVDPCEYSPELSKPFRGLGVWLPLMLHGVEVFRAQLEEKLALARHASERLRTIDGIEIVAEPELSILAFRLVRAGLDGAALDRLNRRLLAQILSKDRVWLTGTVVAGRFVIRIAILSFRTHRERVDDCLEDIAAAVAEI